MRKPYSGNEKPYILALFHCDDRDRVFPVLERLERKGLMIYGFDGPIRTYKAVKAGAAVAFLSENFARDTKEQEILAGMRSRNMPVIAVRLDGTEQPENVGKLLEGANVIHAEELPADELTMRIARTEPLDPPRLSERQKRSARIRTAVIFSLILAAVVACVLSVGNKAFGWFAPSAKRLLLHSWATGDLILLEQLLH